MNTGQIIKGRKRNNFTMLPNEVLKSTELSLEEKGLLAYLLSLPDDWVIYKTSLPEVLNETDYKISKAFSGLQKKKYIHSVKMIDTVTHRFIGWNHAVYDEPLIEDTDNQPRHEIPTVGDADIRQNAPILNTNNTTNKEDTQKPSISFNEQYSFFIKRFNEITKRNFRGDKDSSRNLKNRIKEGYTWKDLEKAIINAQNDKHHIDSGYKYLTPEFITRQDKLEMFLNIVIQQKPKGGIPQGTLN